VSRRPSRLGCSRSRAFPVDFANIQAAVASVSSMLLACSACYTSHAESADGPGRETGEEDATHEAVADEASVSCNALIFDFAREVIGFPGAFTMVARLDYATLEPIGAAVAGGGREEATEEEARAAARLRFSCGADGTMLNPPSPRDQYVFYDAPTDRGCVAAVSGLDAEPTFNATIFFGGTGGIEYPAEWSALPALPDDCPSFVSSLDGRGYDLETGRPLAAEDVRRVLDAANRTALPSAIVVGHYIESAVVLRYPRTVGEFDPATAEWIVLIAGLWLE
jgi:hypothetical protein